MKKLKNKVFMVILSILTIFLVTILIIFNYQYYYSFKNRIIKNLSRTEIMGDKFNEQNRYYLDDEIIKPKKDKDASIKFIDSIIYTVILDNNNNVIHIINNSNDNIELNKIKDVADEIIDNEGKSVIKVKNLYLKRYSYSYNSGNYLIIMDTSNISNELLKTLRFSLFIFIILECFIIFISFKITDWIIKPVIEAFENQKRFIADASHELKTPLSVIMTSSDALGKNMKDNKWINNIKNESDRMNCLIKKLLNLAKMEDDIIKSNYKLTNISKVVELSALTYESLMFEKSIKLNIDIQNDISFLCDVDQIKELMSILLDNAIKYTEKNGDIKIKLYKNKNDIVLEIINKGIAISKSDEEKIFERFYRCDSSRNRSNGNYGLGLAIAKKIVINHNGKITAHSEKGYTEFKTVFK